MNQFFEIPPIIPEQYEALYNLCQYQSNCGLLNAQQVADFIHKSKEWLLRTTYAGNCPFGFGSDKGVGRGNVCYPVLPFFSYMTQGTLFRAIPDRDTLKSMIV